MAGYCRATLMLMALAGPASSATAQEGAAASEPPGSTETAQSASEGPAPDSADVVVRNAFELSRDLGQVTAYPILNLGLGYANDIYREDGEKDDSTFLNLRIGAGVQGENRGHLYGAEYMAERFWYLNGDVENDDETMQRVVGYWGTAFTARNHIDLGVQYLDAYDPRGQDDPRRDARQTTAVDDPDTWNELTAGANYAYGAQGARGRLELGGCYTCREYDNNDQDYRDRDIIDLGVTLLAQVTGRTEAFVQVVYSDFDYSGQSLNDPSLGRNLDSEEWRYMVGASWMASEKLTGITRVGLVQKDFDDPVRGNSDYEEVSWDAIVNWTPTNRDSVSLYYFRSPREPLVWEEDELVDDFVEVEEVGLDWARQLGSNTTINLGGYRGWDDWKPSGRNDDLWGATVGVRYSLPRWGSVGVNYFHRERDSSDPAHEYSDDGIMIDFNIGSLFGFGDSRAPAICLLRSFSSGYNGFSGY